MLSLLAEVAATGALVALAYRVGRGRRSSSDEPAEPVCGCKHHLALHHPKTKVCTHVEYVYHRAGGARLNSYDTQPCPCKQYVGPTPISSLTLLPITYEDE